MGSRGPDPPGEASTAGTLGEPGESAQGRTLRVLVADDVRANQMVGRKILEGLGCRVDVAATGLEALGALQRERYDVVFMDLHMPQMDGLSATRMIRSGAGRVLDPRVPVVAMTGRASGGDAESCRAAGMDDFLEKPIDQAAVRLVLERWTTAGRT